MCHLELKYSIVLYCNVMLLASPAFGFGQDVCAVDSYSAKAKQQQPSELVAELSEALTLTVFKFLVNTPNFPPGPPSLVVGSNTGDNLGVTAEINMKYPRTRTRTSFILI